ncbi:MAG: hypothetical protein ACRD36_02275 [Candidatus Acidiferrum sp.]
MIRLPQRSVTRFFIPLIDVLTLLFCIFLVMPIVSQSDLDARGEAAARAEEVRQLNEELDRLRQAQPDLSRRLREELERLRKEKVQALKDRLAVRVLEIDGATGKLYYRDPDRVEIRNQADARALIDRDRREHGVGQRELYYLILYPRDRNSDYPTVGQRQKYERWFDGVALAFDVPGAAANGGKQP